MDEPTTEQPHRPELDISRVEADTGPVRRLDRISDAREPGFVIVAQRSVIDAVHAHGESDTGVEICGVLVGNVHHDRISPYLLIDGHIRGDKATSKQTQVTFTAETWDSIQKAMERDHAGKKIVGWYHTHPGFGLFLSGMDLFIQDNFFNLPWQVAWVYDPIARIDGMFVWREGRSEKVDFLIEEDRETTASTSDSIGPTSPGEKRRSSRQWMIAFIVLFMAGFVGAWFLLLWLTQKGFKVSLPIE
jgi:proteasome lid subunit RPN8/RPN11